MKWLYLLPILVQAFVASAQPGRPGAAPAPGPAAGSEVQSSAPVTVRQTLKDIGPAAQFSDPLVIPPAVAKAVLACSGPTFGNALLTNDMTEAGFGSCFKCLGIIPKELPCIMTFLKTKDITDLFKCGVNKNDICSCVDCLPGAVGKIIGPLICSSTEAALPGGDGQTINVDTIPVTNELAHLPVLESNDISDRGVLGTISNVEIALAKMNVAAQSILQSPPTTESALVEQESVVGPCGNCPMCIGFCVFGKCVGVCPV